MPVSRKKLFLVAVSIFLMGQVLARVDWERMREAFLGVDIGLFVSSTFLAVALGGIFGVRLHAVFAGTPLQGGLLRFVRISYVACYYALFSLRGWAPRCRGGIRSPGAAAIPRCSGRAFSWSGLCCSCCCWRWPAPPPCCMQTPMFFVSKWRSCSWSFSCRAWACFCCSLGRECAT